MVLRPTFVIHLMMYLSLHFLALCLVFGDTICHSVLAASVAFGKNSATELGRKAQGQEGSSYGGRAKPLLIFVLTAGLPAVLEAYGKSKEGSFSSICSPGLFFQTTN